MLRHLSAADCPTCLSYAPVRTMDGRRCHSSAARRHLGVSSATCYCQTTSSSVGASRTVRHAHWSQHDRGPGEQKQTLDHRMTQGLSAARQGAAAGRLIINECNTLIMLICRWQRRHSRSSWAATRRQRQHWHSPFISSRSTRTLRRSCWQRLTPLAVMRRPHTTTAVPRWAGG
jgi:hypothetical protein